MRQFTVYASDGSAGGGCAVYMVNFTKSGVVACPLREGWHRVVESLERDINRKYFATAAYDPFTVSRNSSDNGKEKRVLPPEPF